MTGCSAGLGLITAAAICMFSIGLLRDHGGDVLFYPPAMISVAALPWTAEPATPNAPYDEGPLTER